MKAIAPTQSFRIVTEIKCWYDNVFSLEYVRENGEKVVLYEQC